MNITVIVIEILQGMIMTGISSVDIQTLAVLKRILQVREDLPPEVEAWLSEEVEKLENKKG